MSNRAPLATYRVQLTPGFGFRDAADIAGYLAELGVTHLYSSPQLEAAPGSSHGYDVVDHGRASSQLGGPEAHRELTAALAAAGLGHVLDIVPNHMAIGGAENRWWWDVLEDGPASRFARVFDVEWPDHRGEAAADGDDRILLPVLGDHYVRVLGAGDLHVEREGASFVVRYFEHRFPVSPRTLDHLLAHAAEGCGSDELAFLADAFGALPAASSTDEHDLARRHRDKEVLRGLLDRLLEASPEAGAAIDEATAELDASPEQLDALLRRQNYRLAHWRTAGQELDYRRFFDIATLAGLRTEDPAVFADTHRLVLAWCRDGRVDGLRVDHPDGLRDPKRYLERLATAAAGAWVVVEKILTGDEALPAWPVAGTTGYEVLNVLLGLYVDPAGEAAFTELYAEVTGERATLAEVIADSKRQVLDQVLAADLERLAGHARRLVGAGGYGDYTLADLRGALAALLVAFPVYRTYVAHRPDGAVEVSEADREVVARALAAAHAARPDLDAELLELLGRALLIDLADPAALELSARFQQLSGPVMAKGVEDTAFYRYHRFVALNEVGGEPDRFGVSPAAFHAHNRHVAERWPATMTTTSTHDTKRSEDVRARLALLSEIPERWGEAVRRWRGANEAHWGGSPPDRNAEYLLYQVLVGSHPLPADRAVAYLAKAAREAKVHTSWLAPDAAYEAALEGFVRGVLADEAFSAELHAFVAPLVGPGRATSLSQLLLKLASPGVPDLYQGTELWDDSLVDPDNRRPVDYARRRALLAWLTAAPRRPEEVLARADEGVPKLWVAHQALAARRAHPHSFMPGSGYHPLEARGEAAGHVVALARSTQGGEHQVVAVAPRLVLGLERRGGWGATTLELPPGRWRERLSGGRFEGAPALGELLGRFPVALLTREGSAADGHLPQDYLKADGEPY